MIEWLIDNSPWIGALGSIATILALFIPWLIKNKSKREKVVAKNGGVAAGGNMEGNTIITNHSSSSTPKNDNND